MTIYDRIRILRKSLGMSQQELALKVGYEGRSAISKVEKGERDISQSMIIKYADVLGTTPTYLLFGDEETEESPEEKRIETFVNIFRGLTETQQDFILAAMQGLVAKNEGGLEK